MLNNKQLGHFKEQTLMKPISMKGESKCKIFFQENTFQDVYSMSVILCNP